MEKLREMFASLHIGVEPHDENNGLRLPTTQEERKVIGKVHLYKHLISYFDPVCYKSMLGFVS